MWSRCGYAAQFRNWALHILVILAIVCLLFFFLSYFLVSSLSKKKFIFVFGMQMVSLSSKTHMNFTIICSITKTMNKIKRRMLNIPSSFFFHFLLFSLSLNNFLFAHFSHNLSINVFHGVETNCAMSTKPFNVQRKKSII